MRRTGGLADTVHDVADAARPERDRCGFVFDAPRPADAAAAVGRALDAYAADGGAWWDGTLVPRCLRQDHSWGRSGQEYLEVYRSALRARRG